MDRDDKPSKEIDHHDSHRRPLSNASQASMLATDRQTDR